MIVDDLKKSLYLAGFQGKLSKQIDSDSNVDSLLKSIINDKNIDSKELKRRKINKESSEPYQIPPNWKWIKLGYLCDVIRGLTFSTSYKTKTENTILVLRGGNIDSKTEKIIYEDNIYVDSTIPNDNQYLQSGDILIVASSGTKTSVGKSAYIDDIDEKISFGGFMMVVRPYNEIAHPKYISYQLKTYRNKIINDTNGYISNITNEILNNLMIPLPPIEEQQRIVDEIETLFFKLDDIKSLENEIELLKYNFPNDMKKSVLKYAITGKLTYQDLNDSSLELVNNARLLKQEAIKNKLSKNSCKPEKKISFDFDVPKNWTKVCIGEISDITSGGTPSRSNSEYWDGGDIPWLKIGDISSKYVDSCSEYITEDGLKHSSAKIFDKGTILYTIFATIGNVGILNFEASTNQAIAGIKLFGHLNIEYIYYVCLALKDVLMKKGRGCAQMNINQEILNNVEIPIPPLDEQQRIVKKIEQLLPLCDDIDRLVSG